MGPGPLHPHLRSAAAFAEVLAGLGTGRVVDLGAGSGVPGLAAAVLLPGWTWLLLDANRRRANFLVEASARLGVGERVAVVAERAEAVGRDPAQRGRWDAVVARSFGPPAVTAECAAALLRTGGSLVVAEPPAEDDTGGEERWPPAGVAALGLGRTDRRAGPPALVVLRQEAPCPDRYPRRVGVPGKRPLW